MDTIVRVKSVGVLGLSSKITTFVIDIELDGGKLKLKINCFILRILYVQAIENMMKV